MSDRSEEQKHLDEKVKDQSWQAADLEKYINGTVKAATPNLGARDDDVCLLYPGKTHSLVGESEAGKTWLALWWCAQEIKKEHYVLYLDFEDSPEGVIERLLLLGVKPDGILEYFIYVNPEFDQYFVGKKTLIDLEADRCSLAVIDGVTEAMAILTADSIQSDWNGKYAEFQMQLPKVLADMGPAVLMLDHPTKADGQSDKPSRYASGAGHKIRGLTGASYVMVTNEPCGRGRKGRSSIYCAKDRAGHVRQYGEWNGKVSMVNMGTMTVDDTRRSLAMSFTSDVTAFVPTALMEKISKTAAGDPGNWWSKNELFKAIGGKREYVLQAVDELVKRDFLSTRIISGHPMYQHHKDYESNI